MHPKRRAASKASECNPRDRRRGPSRRRHVPGRPARWGAPRACYGACYEACYGKGRSRTPRHRGAAAVEPLRGRVSGSACGLCGLCGLGRQRAHPPPHAACRPPPRCAAGCRNRQSFHPGECADRRTRQSAIAPRIRPLRRGSRSPGSPSASPDGRGGGRRRDPEDRIPVLFPLGRSKFADSGRAARTLAAIAPRVGSRRGDETVRRAGTLQRRGRSKLSLARA